MKLTHQNYGKGRVRVLKVFRAGKTHSVKELDVQVMLQGNFETVYTKADNRLVVATDSMKNTVNVLAKQKLGAENEDFGLILGAHFLKKYRQVKQVEIKLSERNWDRISVNGKPHSHSFALGSSARLISKIICTKKESLV